MSVSKRTDLLADDAALLERIRRSPHMLSMVSRFLEEIEVPPESTAPPAKPLIPLRALRAGKQQIGLFAR